MGAAALQPTVVGARSVMKC